MRVLLIGIFLLGFATHGAAQNVVLDSPDSPSGYIARLLINEVPFPGDPLYRCEEDTKSGMLEIAWVLQNRVNRIPPGYTRWQIANTTATTLVGVLTAPGQVQDFYRNDDGSLAMAPRVEARIQYLLQIANDGSPGRFARLLNRAQSIARDFVASAPPAPDIYASLTQVGDLWVTGFGYAWMTADLPCDPGGAFVGVPRRDSGLLGANRFYTLRRVGE
ncbi:MAG: hypothetical protein U1F98_11015 [Verrucomicrobiota bacterium]